MNLWPDSFLLENDKTAKWRYDQGVILKGIEGIWNNTGNGEWFRYIQKSMDHYIGEDGSIKGYRPDEYNIDHVNNGKLLLLLYKVTQKEKYLKAANLLRNQLRSHPRTSEGGFWHKKIYPGQMWLDGLYMAEPFYAEYASLFAEDTSFNDITRQFVLIEKNLRDEKTGLLYHGWDESRQQKWANPATGLSPNFWGRALGWFGMAMVDALDHFPQDHPGRESIIGILKRFAAAVTAYQDNKTGLWFDIVDKQTLPKNYTEASASSMMVYSLAKGVRMGYLSPQYLVNAQKAYDGIIKTFIKKEKGFYNLHGTVAVSGLGGNPYRDGSFDYYMSEPVVVNDPKGLGAFINAAVEMEIARLEKPGKNKVVYLDNYFNNEWRQIPGGPMSRWHYTWNDKSNGGYAMLGHLFNKYGATTKTLNNEPTAVALKNASVYIIVDPDTEKETKNPAFINSQHIKILKEWVEKGGVLVLLGNDAGNAEFNQFNKLAATFGVRFNEDSRNRVENDRFEQGVVTTPQKSSVFGEPKKLYIKEYSSLSLSKPAIALVKNGSDNVMAVSKIGKGIVFALGDPWIYNEYLDGRKLPVDFQNYKAAEAWVQWLLRQSKVNNNSEIAATGKIIVSPDGKGDFRSIQGALNSLSKTSVIPRTILIRDGNYNEKLYIEKDNVVLEGESRKNTIITSSIARDEWRCTHMDDWGVATINVDANDITLKNLTVTNSFGFDFTSESTIPCPSDTVTGEKKLTRNSHQMALRTMYSTRLKAINCHFRAFGGDTVSPWEVDNGMWYFRDCVMEGGVDFYCPRGWAWAENCEFIAHGGTAAIWHDGSKHKDSKTVLKNCRFSGYDNFYLGRYHRDAQFFLIDCVFAANMRDSSIYRVPTSNILQWGHRVYYYNCRKESGRDYSWYANNLPGEIKPEDLTVIKVFNHSWDPTKN
jgi:unsaturated rhamnogalacturonyl hydrolase